MSCQASTTVCHSAEQEASAEALLAQLLRRRRQRAFDLRGRRDIGFRPEEQLVEPVTDAVDMCHGDPRQRRRVLVEQALQLDLQRKGETPRERRDQHARLRIAPRQMRRPVQGDHGLAGTGGPRHPRRAAEASLHQLPLRRMQEDWPSAPRDTPVLGAALPHSP